MVERLSIVTRIDLVRNRPLLYDSGKLCSADRRQPSWSQSLQHGLRLLGWILCLRLGSDRDVTDPASWLEPQTCVADAVKQAESLAAENVELRRMGEDALLDKCALRYLLAGLTITCHWSDVSGSSDAAQ